MMMYGMMKKGRKEIRKIDGMVVDDGSSIGNYISAYFFPILLHIAHVTFFSLSFFLEWEKK